ncbi:WD repeat-containing protein WRAP73 [Octopus bimaculoides]|uniref:Anaphase-promoting complex subunit 4 WD40 domain-containing protein n=1 Tax=Octopus bimaculoides TaxID=37653 RepID=A0A0L8H8H1_OCTBM|nr:WD repeat-containing protein WRAP73 [Octopus bimaculoides]|eukprot:XP_014774667.1 PREDICTED: WD repeat-containing protein WRAP73-like [Octopus bimaculoides]
MNFSELYRQSNQLCEFSPNGEFLAIGSHYKLIIRNVITSQIEHLFTCMDFIQYIEWSRDSSLILCGMFKRGLVQVWSLKYLDWSCKIDEGSAGLRNVHWGPDGLHILTTADFNLRITVWSLTNKSISYIRYPKQCEKGYDYSQDGLFMALAERRDCSDFISIFACKSWELIKHFSCATDDLNGLKWSPSARILAVWDSLLVYKILMYSADGYLLRKYSPYEHALGIKCVSWSPTGQFLAIGSFDEKVRLLNNISWKTSMEKGHPLVVKPDKVTIYKEEVSMGPLPTSFEEISSAMVALCSKESKYHIVKEALEIPNIKPSLNKANPELGVSQVEFSCNSRYFYTKNDNMPCVLWIWDVKNLCLSHILVHLSPIKHVRWDPTSVRLALSTGNKQLYMWTPSGCLSAEIPIDAMFQVNTLKWHPDGSALVLIGKEKTCISYLTGEQTDDQ